MEEVGNNVADGWISYNGELVPFVGGPKQATWIVEELSESRLFADQVTRSVYFTRRARFGSGGNAYSSLQRIETLVSLRDSIANMKTSFTQMVNSVWKKGDVIEIDCDAKYIADNFNSTGLGTNERAGWAICNGNNGTKNRMGRVPVGYDPSRADYNTPGKTGGAESVVLTVDQMPAHSHNFAAVGYNGLILGNSQTAVGRVYNLSYGEWGAFMTNTGNDQAHENRPPFIVTLFIQKL
jgi:hypothetical protein